MKPDYTVVLTEDEIDQGEFVLPVVDGKVNDVITMAPGWPRIGTPEFDDKLADWFKAHGYAM